jgi:hypothetical protein
LIAGAPASEKKWPEDKRDLMPGLALYQAQAILNSQIRETPIVAPSLPETRETSSTVPSAILLDQVHLHSLQSENNDLRAALDEAKLETKQAVAQALAAQKQARYLAAALRAAQQSSLEHSGIAEHDSADTIITRSDERSTPVSETQES